MARSLYDKFIAYGITHTDHTLSAAVTMFSKIGDIAAAEDISLITYCYFEFMGVWLPLTIF